MSKNSKLSVALSALLVLSACGGGSSGKTAANGGATVTNPISFASIRAAGENVTDISDTYTLTPDADIPTTMNATYDGIAGVVEGFDPESEAPPAYAAIGRSSITVNFETEQVGATLDNFYEIDLNGRPFDEQLLTDAAIDDSATAVAASFMVSADGNTITGTLTKVSGEIATYNFTAGDVEFSGPAAESLFTQSFGTSSANGRATVNAGLLTAGARN